MTTTETKTSKKSETNKVKSENQDKIKDDDMKDDDMKDDDIKIVSKKDVTKKDVTKNEVTKNEVTKNEVTKNEVTKNEVTKNEVTKKKVKKVDDKEEESLTNAFRDDDFADIFAYADKREAIIWTEEEVRILKDALNKYGKGNWRKILDSIKDDLNPNRRLKDLSDKVRILDQMTTYRRRTKKSFWEVDQNNNPICKMGEKVVYNVKLPFEAAEKCALTKNYSNGEGKIIKICYEEAGRLWYHVYVAKYSRDPKLRQRIRVRKVAGQSPYRNDGM